MKRTLFLRASLSLSLGWLAFSASGQVTMTTSATNSDKSYLGVDNRAVVTNIDTLYARLNALSSSAGSLTWADVLDNGAQASQDLDLNGHIATGANRIEADSLEASRAEITDSLLVRGDADFDGNLNVAGDLYVGGVQVVPGGGGGGADTTAIWLGVMMMNSIPVVGDTLLPMMVLAEEDDANVFSASANADSVTVGVEGIYEIQTAVYAEYQNSVNDGLLSSVVLVNGNGVPWSTTFAGFMEDPTSQQQPPLNIAAARSTLLLPLLAGDAVSLEARAFGTGATTVLLATLSLKKVD
jgi:hypothetical protein